MADRRENVEDVSDEVLLRQVELMEREMEAAAAQRQREADITALVQDIEADTDFEIKVREETERTEIEQNVEEDVASPVQEDEAQETGAFHVQAKVMKKEMEAAAAVAQLQQEAILQLVEDIETDVDFETRVREEAEKEQQDEAAQGNGATEVEFNAFTDENIERMTKIVEKEMEKRKVEDAEKLIAATRVSSSSDGDDQPRRIIVLADVIVRHPRTTIQETEVPIPGPSTCRGDRQGGQKRSIWNREEYEAIESIVEEPKKSDSERTKKQKR